MAAQMQISSLVSDWAAGRTTLKEVEGYSDDEVNAVAQIGYFLLMQGKNKEARTLFEGLIALDPKNDYYYRALGVIFQKLGDHDRAAKQFGYAIRVNPEHPNAYVNRAEVHLALGQYNEADQDLKDALSHMSPRDQQLSRKAWALRKAVMAKQGLSL